MGIPRGTARLLLDEHRRSPFSGSVLELGKMSIHFSHRELSSWALRQGVSLAAIDEVRLSHDPALAALGCIDDRSFFRLLGFNDVVSADASDWEGADILLDLNLPVPPDLRGRFDVVFEAGTIQHVFHLPRVLENIHSLLKTGGRVIHGMSPSTNHVDHGFYMFSPTLFHDFYTANGWRIEREVFFEFVTLWYRGRISSPPWRIYEYTPGCLEHLAYGGFGHRQVGIFVVATKSDGATATVSPQQGACLRLWQERGSPQPAALPPLPSGGLAPPPNPAALLWKRLRFEALRRLPRKMPPLVARY